MPSYIRTRTEFAVNSFTSANQMAPAVSTFADGGFVVVWGTADSTQDGSSSAIKAQLFDSAGNKVGMEFLVNEDASGVLSGNQAFTFIGSAAFSSAAGQLRYSTSGGVTLVSGDVNGDGVADFEIELTGTLAPIASDFVL